MTPFTDRWPRADVAVDVTVTRKGYRPARFAIVPAAAVERTVTLDRLRRTPSAPAAPVIPGELTPTNPFKR